MRHPSCQHRLWRRRAFWPRTTIEHQVGATPGLAEQVDGCRHEISIPTSDSAQKRGRQGFEEGSDRSGRHNVPEMNGGAWRAAEGAPVGNGASRRSRPGRGSSRPSRSGTYRLDGNRPVGIRGLSYGQLIGSHTSVPAGRSAAPRLPVLFVCSSTEDLPVAEQVQLHLDHDAEVEIWSEGTFVPAGYAFASLLDTSQRIDFALIVVSPVDSLSRRGTLHAVARDNVIFEAGLFGGALGQARLFLLQPRGLDLTLPTDLDGMTLLSWDPAKTNLASSVGPACTQLKAAMATLGLRS